MSLIGYPRVSTEDHARRGAPLREHPSHVKETEPVFTLEDVIQQNNAQRRATREMLDQWRKDGT
jgi:hypothetical protein